MSTEDNKLPAWTRVLKDTYDELKKRIAEDGISPSQASLARHFGVSAPTLWLRIHKLEKLGLVKVEGNGRVKLILVTARQPSELLFA